MRRKPLARGVRGGGSVRRRAGRRRRRLADGSPGDRARRRALPRLAQRDEDCSAPSTKLTVKPGTRARDPLGLPDGLRLRADEGPAARARRPRARTPAPSRVLIFRKAGTYRLTATNVQTPEERGLVTLGEPNTLTLTVVVRP